MTQYSISVESLGKSYPAYKSNLHRFMRWFGLGAQPLHEHWANHDISFNLEPGTTLSIIGENGAGKSTLLKLITGTVRPTEGTINLTGRISAILELDIGFNPDFTGRDNVKNVGGLMGFSPREIDDLIPQIEFFAELGIFFDKPVRVYSSGMQARLAFALATAKRPEILIVDEVLSVGDSYFQHKSFDRIRNFRDQGTTIIFVTHSLATVKEISDRVILLEAGKIIKDGLPDEVVDFYSAKMAEKENSNLSIEQRRDKKGWLHTEFGNRKAEVTALSLHAIDDENEISLVETGQTLEVRGKIQISENIDSLVVGHRISDKLGHVVFGTNTWHHKKTLNNLVPGQVVFTKFRFLCNLGSGSYSVSFGVHQSDTHLEDCYHKADNQIIFDVVNGDKPFFIGSSFLESTFDINLGEIPEPEARK